MILYAHYLLKDYFFIVTIQNKKGKLYEAHYRYIYKL